MLKSFTRNTYPTDFTFNIKQIALLGAYFLPVVHVPNGGGGGGGGGGGAGDS